MLTAGAVLEVEVVPLLPGTGVVTVVTGVAVVVVVVATVLVGAGGGGAETTWETGSDEQPLPDRSRMKAPPNIKAGAKQRSAAEPTNAKNAGMMDFGFFIGKNILAGGIRAMVAQGRKTIRTNRILIMSEKLTPGPFLTLKEFCLVAVFRSPVS